MKNYTVEWVIDVTANTPEEAAREALRIQRDPASIATVFSVRGEGMKKVRRIDIDELNEATTNRS